MNQLAGIGKKERSQLARVLKACGTIITPALAAKAINVDQAKAAQLLALWAKKGWLSRVKQGVYIPVSLQAENPQMMVDEPWILAQTLFGPCYIGGWSAAENWDLTEQIFNSSMVFTTKKVPSHKVNLKGASFVLKTTKQERMFGTKYIWIQNQKVAVSDPTKTVVDGFNDPAVVGGIRMAVDVLIKYLKSEHKNLNLLFDYSAKMKNTAIFKRLGFIFETSFPKEEGFIEKCKSMIKSGYSQLDPATPGDSLATRWNLWVPASMKKGSANDQY